MFADIHEDGRFLYPGTGAAEEIGSGAAVGTKLNLPLPPGASDAEFLAAWPAIEAHLDATRRSSSCSSAAPTAWTATRSRTLRSPRRRTPMPPRGCAHRRPAGPRPRPRHRRRRLQPAQPRARLDPRRRGLRRRRPEAGLSGTLRAAMFCTSPIDASPGSIPARGRARRRAPPPGRAHRADRLGELHEPARARGAGLGADQQVRRGLSRASATTAAASTWTSPSSSRSTARSSCSAPTTPTCSRTPARRRTPRRTSRC